MEQRLIDGLSLWAELKRLEELARDRYLDTPSSSPAHTRYCEQMRGRTALKEMVSAQPAIDPLHALGACYCKECKHYIEIHEEQGEGICGRECLFEQPHVRVTDFCSCAQRK